MHPLLTCLSSPPPPPVSAATTSVPPIQSPTPNISPLALKHNPPRRPPSPNQIKMTTPGGPSGIHPRKIYHCLQPTTCGAARGRSTQLRGLGRVAGRQLQTSTKH